MNGAMASEQNSDLTALADNATGPDGFTVTSTTPYAQAHLVLNRLEREMLLEASWSDVLLKKAEEVAKRVDPALEADLLIATLERSNWLARRRPKEWERRNADGSPDWRNENLRPDAINQLLALLLGRALRSASTSSSRQKRPFTIRAEQLERLLELLLEQQHLPPGHKRDDRHTISRIIVDCVRANGLPPQLRPLLEQLDELHNSPHHAMAGCLAHILGYGHLNLMPPGSRWVNIVLKELAAMEAAQREPWISLLRHAATADDTGKPTKRWLRAAEQIVEQIGREEFETRLAFWLSQIRLYQVWWHPVAEELCYLNGLVRIAALATPAQIAGVIGQVAIACDDYSLRTCRHSCFLTLAVLPGQAPTEELVRLQTHVSDRVSQQMLSRIITDIGKRNGLSRYDLDDLATPTFDLSIGGTLCRRFGDYEVEVSFPAANKAIWQWRHGKGKPQKTTPAEVKRDHSQALDALKATVGEIEEMREFQAARLEKLYLTRHDWSLNDWRRRYPGHPLLQGFASRLIWQVTEGTDESGGPCMALGLWREERLEDLEGQALIGFTDAARVKLWHPVASPVETVLAWRTRLETLGIVQPFKQAFREAYLLTDAERATALYSNRFAGHVIRQHPFHRLCKKMGWKNRLRGVDNVSADKRASYPLPEWGLTAEFWIEPVDDERTLNGQITTYDYLSTDQVRFCTDNRQPVPLADVPLQLFWEIMRDVDRLVTHAALANDPTWQDRGVELTPVDPAARYTYKEDALGLPERRAVLARLLPRLKIASHCTLEETFLLVRGNVRHYRIHLGTGNIFMTPNDQYLCIVRSRTPADANAVNPAALPFEGDTTLAMILSKAVLLADDLAITDPVILSQIRRC
jgi:hypothetical protein